MKFPRLLLFLILFFCSNQLGAQDSDFSPKIKLGVLAGLNYATVEDVSGNLLDIQSVGSFHLGIGINFHMFSKVSFDYNFLLNRKGFESILIPTASTRLNFNNLSSQLLAKYHITKNIILLAGPEFSLIGVISQSGSFVELDMYFNGIDFSLIGGIEIAPFDWLSLNLKYNHSLSSLLVLNTTDSSGNLTGQINLKHRVIMAGLTFYPFRFES